MNIGDRVRVVELDGLDTNTNIEIDDECVVVVNGSRGVYHVEFDKEIITDENECVNDDGTYQMYNWQLEVIGEKE